MDSQVNWYIAMEGYAPKSQSSFLMMLVYEIGHVLGLSRSAFPTAIMFPWYEDKNTALSPDHINALEYLYGSFLHLQFLIQQKH